MIALYRWALAGVSAAEAGRSSVPADNAVIGIAPIGLINAGDPRQAAADARQVAGFLNDGPSHTAVGTVAAAVAAAFTPGATPKMMIAPAWRVGCHGTPGFLLAEPSARVNAD